MQFVLRTIAIFVAVAVAAWLVPGIEVIGTGAAWASILIVALVIALLNMTIKPILQLLGLPITIISLGVFYLVINTLLLYLAAGIRRGIRNCHFRIGLCCRHCDFSCLYHHERYLGRK